MLTLINIEKNNSTIKAEYIPENSSYKAHIAIDLLTKECNMEDVPEYGAMYSRMAVNGLWRIAEELSKGKIYDIPKERVVMWY